MDANFDRDGKLLDDSTLTSGFFPEYREEDWLNRVKDLEAAKAAGAKYVTRVNGYGSWRVCDRNSKLIYKSTLPQFIWATIKGFWPFGVSQD
jgi:hypothetical protein